MAEESRVEDFLNELQDMELEERIIAFNINTLVNDLIEIVREEDDNEARVMLEEIDDALMATISAHQRKIKMCALPFHYQPYCKAHILIKGKTCVKDTKHVFCEYHKLDRCVHDGEPLT